MLNRDPARQRRVEAVRHEVKAEQVAYEQSLAESRSARALTQARNLLMGKAMENRATRPGGFDVQAFFTTFDERRRHEALSWAALAEAVWAQSRVLNERLGDHPLSPATLRHMAEGGGSCQHALFVLRWLDCPPETFVVQPRPGTTGVSLPATDAAHRLRWNLLNLYTALNTARAERTETWQVVAERLHCTPSQLTGLRTAKFATGMRLAMRITQALQRPAADFIEPATW